VCYDGKKKKKKKNCGCYETGSKGFLEQYFFFINVGVRTSFTSPKVNNYISF
jgi:hypothetical protein